MVESVIVTARQTYHYGKPEEHPYRKLIDAANNGEDIWYEFQDGAREGSIAKVVDPTIFQTTGYSGNVYLDRSILVEVSPAEGDKPAKQIKVGIKAYHNNHKFLVGYTGGHVVKFEKGKPKAVIKETAVPDMLGNTIKVGDWVICKPKRAHKPVLGKLNRLSAAGNAWVMVTNKQGEQVEEMTEGATTLIKIEFTPELHTTYMLYDGFDGLRTKLKLDLDYEAMEAGN
ncbi:MAG: hypothetical protein M0R77_13105 [Gammaproteobacteria bacterium]|nr:hypothetical protein [Gammaproteobacteria bacterium]